MRCNTCDCPLTLLLTKTGKRENRKICIRCREESAISYQVGLLETHAQELQPKAPPVSDKPMGQVLRIDQFLQARSKKRSLLM